MYWVSASALSAASISSELSFTSLLRNFCPSSFSSYICRYRDTFQFCAPQGSSIAFPRLLTKEPVASFCDRVVKESGVFLLPADVYAHQPSIDAGHFRLGLGRSNFKAGLKAFEAYLKRQK